MKPNLVIENPFSFQLEIESSTDSPKGFRCAIAVEYEVYRRRINLLIADNWFEEAVFDEFVLNVENLKKGTSVEAVLYDSDRELFYRINDEWIQLEINKLTVGDDLEVKLAVESTPELISLTLEALQDFPKWW